MGEQIVIGVDIDGINLRVGSVAGNLTRKINISRLSVQKSILGKRRPMC